MQQSPVKPNRLKALRVLVADEQPQARRFFSDLCRSLGLPEIATVHSSDQVISALEEAPFDVFLCNWGPHVDAPQLTRHIRADSSKRYQRIRIIVLRADAMVADVQAARDSGADEFVAMPLSQGSLLAALHRVSTAPQHFVECDVYKGPCRRRRRLAWENERRQIETAQRAKQKAV